MTKLESSDKSKTAKIATLETSDKEKSTQLTTLERLLQEKESRINLLIAEVTRITTHMNDANFIYQMDK